VYGGLGRRLAIVGAVTLLVAGAGTWWVGSILIAPAVRSIAAPPASLDAREVTFSSSSGSTLHGWLVPGQSKGGGVVLAHSVRSDRREMIGRAEFLRASGYSLLLFDQQAHGASPGENITFGYLESLDARAAVAYVRSELPDERVGYLGVSQGGAAALIGSEPLEVDALIVEAVYPTLREAVTNRVALRLGPVSRLVAPFLLVQSGLRIGVDPDSIAPIHGIADIRAPLLLIAGARDRHTTLAESERMFAAAREPKELWVLREAAHQNFHELEPRGYEQRVLEFFAKHLRMAR